METSIRASNFRHLSEVNYNVQRDDDISIAVYLYLYYKAEDFVWLDALISRTGGSN